MPKDLPTAQELPSNSVLCILAPTASGKTELAFKLHATGRFDIISVDSALIYQAMDIGTAKPTAQQLRRHPHHLVNILPPHASYSVAQFISDCQRLINASHKRGKIPLLIGGTMMYFMALFDGISALPATDVITRQAIAELYQTGGNRALFDYLQQYDPQICTKLSMHDTQRLMRAAEVYWQTGIPFSILQSRPKIALSNTYAQKWYGLCVMPDRAWLHQRIAHRLDIMWQTGFVDEIRMLIDTYQLHPAMPSMRCIGYRQVLDFLLDSGQVLLQEGVLQKNPTKRLMDACQSTKNQALYATRQLAKRQYTWMRQLSAMSSPTITTVSTPKTIAVFESIAQLEKHLL